MTSDPTQRSVLLIGLTDAGKTNFLSRLWIALSSNNGLLVKNGLPSVLNYLNDGAAHLLKGEFAPHTPHDVRDSSEIPVKGAANDSLVGTLVVPDVPGEEVLRTYRTRQWSTDWESRVVEGTGALLFVRVDSDDLVAPLDWVTCPRLCGAAGFREAPEPKKDDEGTVIPPTQVVLVDWLQFLRKAFTEKVGGQFIPRVGIVVAAWDRAPEAEKESGPEAWVRANLPMLWQFAVTNQDSFEIAFFAVSVSSGDFAADPAYKQAYLDGNPFKAGEVVHQLCGSVETTADITLPVAWALGLPTAELARRA